MKGKRWLLVGLVLVCALALVATPALAKKNPLAAWKAKFDPKGAKYKVVFSNISHPAIIGVRAGYWVRDTLWKASNGQVYFDYRPLAQLGGEVEVLNLLQTGAIQGMNVSSVASTNLGPRMGVVNLPFLVNDYDKLDKFVAAGDIYQHFLDSMEHQGIMGVDISAYGQYGWATTTPVRSIADAKKVKFRIAEAAVNRSNYAAWGLNPVVMPWPDVPTALKQGVIEGLDHTIIVCTLTRKFEIAKYFTQLNYAQGLFIWLLNKAWFKGLPADIQKVVVDSIRQDCAKARAECRVQQADMEKTAQDKYKVEFIQLSAADMETLRVQGKKVHQEWAPQIGADYLKKVQALMGFK